MYCVADRPEPVFFQIFVFCARCIILLDTAPRSHDRLMFHDHNTVADLARACAFCRTAPAQSTVAPSPSGESVAVYLAKVGLPEQHPLAAFPPETMASPAGKPSAATKPVR